MMRRFDASDKYTKELRGDLANIGQKVDAHVISIKILNLQMAQLSTIVNTCQRGTLPRNTFKIRKIMEITWQSLLEEVSKLLICLYHLW